MQHARDDLLAGSRFAEHRDRSLARGETGQAPQHPLHGRALGDELGSSGPPGRDRILARVTAGEYIMRPEAVRKYGIGMMSAINAMRVPLDGLRGFSVGGLVEGVGASIMSALAIPHYAGGGLALAGGGSVRVDLDLRTDRGRFRGSVMADAAVAEALTRYAVKDQLLSTGPKPGTYR